jgi:uncharacterized DUF497 family protein
MIITYDPAKREATLRDRGLDFEDAAVVFAAPGIVTVEDTRRAYPEKRYQTFGFLGNRLVMICWTPYGRGIRVFSMRKCNEREAKKYQKRSVES